MSYQAVKQVPSDADVEMMSLSIKKRGQVNTVVPGQFQDSKEPTWRGKLLRILLGAAILIVLGIIITRMISSRSAPLPVSKPIMSDIASFDASGRYMMRNFDDVKPSANFLAGLGGLWGVPMWAFYVNKGQGITAFGVQNKDGGIAKFNTAEKAYQQTAFTGFRTFVKGSREGGSRSFTHMPFFPNGLTSSKSKPVRNMMIGMSEMEIEEVATEFGLKTNVLYFTVPDEEFASLVRRTTFTNLDPTSTLTLDVLDGLGKLQPSGISNGNLDAIGRTMEAWMNVYNTAPEGEITEPFFHISQGTGDTAQVQIIKDGHFAVAFVEEGDGVRMGSSGLYTPLPFVVDPSVVFDTDTSLTNPSGFFGEDAPGADEISKLPQGTTSRTPCSFAAVKIVIAPGASVTVTSIYGHANSLETFLGTYSPKMRSEGYIPMKRKAAAELVNSITNKVATSTGSPLFDAYMKQNFLDNTLRGGLPIPIGNPLEGKIYHTFSRIHGDLERDYNNLFEASYFSQGPGNFRDVSQNRRNDVTLSPVVGDFNIRMFLSFVQADGYNPLTVASTNFKIPATDISTLIQGLGISDSTDILTMEKLFKKSFRIGSLFSDMKTAGVSFSIDKEDFLTKIIGAAKQVFAGQFAQNGFWADHWTYTLDLLDNYLSIFPDKEEHLLWDSDPIPFFMSPAVIKSRADRYSLVPNPLVKDAYTVRVYSAISVVGDKDFPADRAWALQQIYSGPDFVADASGAGGVWQRSTDQGTFSVTAIAKLSMLGILKFSTLDPMGLGVEMEGGKPGWNDAMNGLPGLIGSGMAETYEMLRIVRYVKAAVSRYGRGVMYPKEFSDFLTSLGGILAEHSKSEMSARDEFLYWDATNTAREKYRHDVSVMFSGDIVEIPPTQLLALLTAMEGKTDNGISRAIATTGGISPSYFYYECVDYGIYPKDNSTVLLDPKLIGQPPPVEIPKIFCREFATHTLPNFLEGSVRYMKTLTEKGDRLTAYVNTRNSGIYDSSLQMYRLSESLESMGQDVGRMKAFSPGWLENQSIWLHMSYKFYLELLRGGLYSEFYDEISTGLVPFMNNKVYGRSPLEAASFIVSSAFPDKKLHGASFLARLTGSTAEMMSMWAIMMAGHKPFTVDHNGILSLSLSPILPAWMFTQEGKASFTFLGGVKVTYHNSLKADSWTLTPRASKVLFSDGTKADFLGGVLKGSVAERTRNLDVSTIDIYY